MKVDNFFVIFLTLFNSGTCAKRMQLPDCANDGVRIANERQINQENLN
jgi:hypothetical protein